MHQRGMAATHLLALLVLVLVLLLPNELLLLLLLLLLLRPGRRRRLGRICLGTVPHVLRQRRAEPNTEPPVALGAVHALV